MSPVQREDSRAQCKEVARFRCHYVIASNGGFHVGNVEASCEHCLSRFLKSYGGQVLSTERITLAKAQYRY